MTGWTSSTKLQLKTVASAQSLVIPTESQWGQHDQTRVRLGSKLFKIDLKQCLNKVKISDVFFLQLMVCLRLQLWMIRLEKDNSSSVSLLWSFSPNLVAKKLGLRKVGLSKSTQHAVSCCLGEYRWLMPSSSSPIWRFKLSWGSMETNTPGPYAKGQR